jgi:superfamily I DNA and RNA helicase
LIESHVFIRELIDFAFKVFPLRLHLSDQLQSIIHKFKAIRQITFELAFLSFTNLPLQKSNLLSPNNLIIRRPVRQLSFHIV